MADEVAKAAAAAVKGHDGGDTIFGKIIRREIKADIVYVSPSTIDADPSPVTILDVPRMPRSCKGSARSRVYLQRHHHAGHILMHTTMQATYSRTPPCRPHTHARPAFTHACNHACV